jgi:putative aldouronate transport system substrate-binding protein
MKRSIGLNLLSMVVIVVLLASCTPASKTQAPESTQGQTVATEVKPAEVPTATQVPAQVYKVVMYQNSPWYSVLLPDPNDDVNHQYILENYGIDLEIQLGPAEDQDAKLGAMIAAGEVPDFFQAYWDISSTMLNQLIDQDLILPIDVSQYNGIKNALPQDAWIYLTRDGKIWGFAPPNDPVHQINWIRQDWLETLGLKAPTNMDELAEVAIAFATRDPDGNGENDTYGMSDIADHARTDCFFAPFGSTLLSPDGGVNFAIEDNQVYIPELSEGAKQSLEWWKALVDAGAVDPDWTTNTRDMWRESLAQDKFGIACNSFQLLRKSEDPDSVGSLLDATGSKANWVQLPAYTGPDGQYETFSRGPLLNAFFVTNQAQSEPGKYEALMRFLNDAVNAKTDLYRQLIWGIEGVTYQTNDQGQVIERTMDDAHLYMGYYRVFRTGNEEYWMGSWGKNEPFMVTGIEYARQQPRFQHYTGLVPTHTSKPDLDQFVREMQIKFITGEVGFDEWDTFVNDAMTKYNGQTILDDATAKLKVPGLVK